MTVTDTDLDTQIALQDYRLRVLNRQPIQAHEYRQLILSLRRNRESKAAAMAADRKRATKAVAAPQPIDVMKLFGPQS